MLVIPNIVVKKIEITLQAPSTLRYRKSLTRGSYIYITKHSYQGLRIPQNRAVGVGERGFRDLSLRERETPKVLPFSLPKSDEREGWY